MGVRSIVCLHNGADYEAESVAAAVGLAKHYKARLRIVHAAFLARPSAEYFGATAALGGGFHEALERQVRADLAAARDSATRLCELAGLPISEPSTEVLPRSEFIPETGLTTRTLLRDLSLCDLIVAGAMKGASAVVDDSLVSLALFSAGRPLMIVRPQAGVQNVPLVGKPACVAWTDTPEAINALVKARPLLQTASSVHVVSAHRRRADGSSGAGEAKAYLASHGIETTVHEIEQGRESAATAVLEAAMSMSAGYLVMGAYGHSVFREMLIGGFTEGMLEQAEFPLILAH